MSSLMRLIWCLFFLPTFLLSQEIRFTILNISDPGYLVPQEDRGGLAELMTLLEQERERSEFHLTAMYSTFKIKEENLDILNEMKIDFAVLAKEDLESNLPDLQKKIESANFSFLASNLIDLEGNTFTKEKNLLIYQVKDCKIGIFGLINFDHPTITEKEMGLCFLSHLYIARKKIADLKEHGCNFIIVISGMNLREDMELARLLTDIDVIIGSHNQFPVSFYEKDTLIYKTEKGKDFVDRIDLIIEHKTLAGGEYHFFYPSWRKIQNHGFHPDPRIAEKIKDFQRREVSEK